jgi:putative nucleotidyltransferase with HDIG domain
LHPHCLKTNLIIHVGKIYRNAVDNPLMSQAAIQILQKADVDKLPSLPHIILHLLDICQNESLSISELAKTIKQDAGLFARIMSACDRDRCSKEPNLQPTATSDMEQALQDLGINSIKSIVASAAVQQFFSRNNLERTDFLKQHWQHSLLCANVAKSLARHISYHDPEEAYISGLLHDIGQLVLENAFPEKYTGTFAQLSEDEYFHSLENEEFNTTHQQVSAELLAKHGASNFIVDAALYHHETSEQILDAHPLVRIVNLANMLSSSYFKEEDQQVFDAAKDLLGLDKALVMEILGNAVETTGNIARSMGIETGADGLDGESAKQQNATDEFKQLQLAEQIRNIALLDGLHQHLSRCTQNNDTQQALLSVISQHTGILFGISQCVLFLYDAGDDRLHAVAANDQPVQLNDISIPLKANRSLVSEALLNKQSIHSFDEVDTQNNIKLSVVDRQLLGFTGRQGIICLPMMMNNAAVGALVLGVDRGQFDQLRKQMSLLMRFANEVAHTISANHPAEKKSAEHDEIPRLEQRIREVLHEVRNPLSIMNNYLGILSHKLDKDKPAQEDVQTIKSEIERISHILNRLTEKEDTVETVSPIDINAIISDLTHVFQTSLLASKNIEISLDLDEQIKTLPSNANTLKQIYTNLIKNAVEALPAKGQIMVYTQDNVNVDGKEHIEISVADDGPGINTEILPKLFSPVESTKGNDHAGLGLTIVKNLVAELHGSISCRSSDKGTSFHILLPKTL